MTNTLDKNIGTDKNIGAEKPLEKDIGSLTHEVQPIAEQLSEYIVIGAEAEGSKKVFEVVATGTQGTVPMTSTRKQILQQQIERVQTMTEQQLVQGIKKAYIHQVHELQREARKIQRSVIQFSAHQLNNILAKIRQIKDEMANLYHIAIEKLRELYLMLVLRLKMVTI